MKTLSDLAGLAGSHAPASVPSYRPELLEGFEVRTLVSEASVEIPRRDASIGKAVRLVGVLAFGQSLLFLALWLLMCASAGAATPKKAEFDFSISQSTYAPTNSRSPLSKPASGGTEVKTEPGVPVRLQLDGILYEAANPAAIVNGRVLLLNKVVTLTSDGAEVKVRAVEITRTRVVVEVAGRKVELLQKNQATTDSSAKR
jgi:hypothetical protein